MKAYIFPGQGSQAKGMGGDLFDEFADFTQKADKILGYSIKELCLQDPDKQLGLTQFTQPALYVVNALSYLKKQQESPVQPDFVLGHSLGEFNALFAAGCYGFEVGLKLVKKRGELMSQANSGAMAAILNATEQEIAEILSENGLDQIDLANFNTQKQIVISGCKTQLEQAKTLFSRDQMMFHPLNTSGAFHSRFMADAKIQFERYLKRFKFEAPVIPVIANVTAKPYQADSIKETLASQIASSVRWFESVQLILNAASDQGESVEWVECGHGQVLTNMIAKTKRELGVKTPVVQVPPVAVTTTTSLTNTVRSDIAAPQLASATDAKLTVEAKINQFNLQFPVGSQFKSTIADYGVLQTRTEAIRLFGHRAAVYMTGYQGYFDIAELTAV